MSMGDFISIQPSELKFSCKLISYNSAFSRIFLFVYFVIFCILLEEFFVYKNVVLFRVFTNPTHFNSEMSLYDVSVYFMGCDF